MTPLKQRLKAGEVVFGPWYVIPSGFVMNIIAVEDKLFRRFPR